MTDTAQTPATPAPMAAPAPSVASQIDALVSAQLPRGDQHGGRPHLTLTANAATREVQVLDAPKDAQVSNDGVIPRLHDDGVNMADAGQAIVGNIVKMETLLKEQVFNQNTGASLGYKIPEGSAARTQLQAQYERAIEGAVWQLQHFEQLAAQRAADADAAAAKDAEERAIIERTAGNPARAAAIRQMVQEEADRDFARSIVGRRGGK